MLSAVVIAQNEELRLEDCLRSLTFADEIIVLDSMSTDRTAEVARACAAKIFQRAFTDFSDQRNHAASLASGDWILAVDADERIQPELAYSILKTLESSPSQTAFCMRRRSFLFKKEFHFSGTQKDWPARLYRQDSGRFVGEVHEIVETSGSTGTLRGEIEHHTFSTIHEYLRRLNNYTELEQARTNFKSTSHVLVRSFARFSDIYFLKQGFRDGMEGFFYSVLSGWYEIIKFVKQWQKAHQAK